MKAAPVKPQSSNKPERSVRERLYEALPYVLLRAPLLPVETYLSLASEDCQQALLSDPRVRAALAIGSTSLLSAVHRFQEGTLSKRDADRMRAKLRRYLIRMSTRPTPYGLFAGVALLPFSAETTVELDATAARSRTRPDMGWLFNLVLTAEENVDIRKQLSWVANPMAFESAGRLFLPERAASRHGRPAMPVSIRATSVARKALALAETPIPYRDLSAELERSMPGATEQKVEKLLTDLYEQTFFITELRPPLTTSDPARYVRDKLAGIREADEIARKLEFISDAISDWDDGTGEEKVGNYGRVLRAAEVPLDGSRPIPVQADMRLGATGSVGRIIADEAVEAAELLLRLSPYPGGNGSVIAYRQAYLNRYGPRREVPLLELLDPQLGLGPLGSQGYANVGPPPGKAAERSRVLTAVACSCLRKHQRVVELDDELVRRLETSELKSRTTPISLDINLQVGARSEADIGRGNFIIVIGPNLGAQAAGRNLGRFADLVGVAGSEFLGQISAAEARHSNGDIAAEIVYLPYNARMANVVIRPAIRSHEVPAGVSPAVEWSHSIPMNELVVGVDENRFYVRWVRTNEYVRFTTGHMLTHYNAPAAVRFLAEAGSDGRMLLNSFDWGPVESFPFLPRVQRGRIVLQPAQWRIYKDAFDSTSFEAFGRGLTRWRQEWDVPQHVCLSAGDNRLILDLDQRIEAEELRSELHRVPEGGWVIVQEVLPDLGDAWLRGSDGHYFSEMVVSLVLRPVQETEQPKPMLKQLAAANGWYSQSSRNRPPGSDWLFVKLYCRRQFEDDMIADALLPFAENMMREELSDSWFFIRYADPERHIRLRFHGAPEHLAGVLFPRLSEWARCWVEQGIFSKIVFDTYEQEVERFGGVEGTRVCEAFFAADSRSAAKLLRCAKKNGWPHDETTFLALSIDQLLGSAGLSEDERRSWYAKRTTARTSDIGEAYRKRKDQLRRAVGDTQKFLSEFLSGDEFGKILSERHSALASVGEKLRQLQEQGALGQTVDDLCSSFVHLHLNRLASSEAPSEHHILGLLQRTRESLRNAPAKR